ncbi:MAG: M48 family metallopeptidase [Desulfuromonadales bacterium]|nr:M48 family metallopeptidase [Desulfuromonadales bacterium]
MTIKRHYIEVSGISVEIVRKEIKNLHLGVYPPEGRVRVAVPLKIDDEAVRLAVISKLGWIKRKQKEFAEQPRQSQREMVSGESHYYLGQRYRLNVIEHSGANLVRLNRKTIDLYVRHGADQKRREAVLGQWYRQQIKNLIPELLTKWEPVVGVHADEWGVKKMKTRWGTCNIGAKRIWLNLELAKKPIQCLEYILVHELVHLLERRHNDRFRDLMDKFMPQWRLQRDVLNKAPLGHEEWGY